jgi:pimeloyl-ACP methyl ester carboxylesterase
MPRARVGEIELSYQRDGSGPPLLMIMGMSGTFDHWKEAFLDGLRNDFETIIYDHRGVGSSSPLDGAVTIAQLAEDAVGLLDALEIESPHVLGISMGGMVAQELALGHPERVRTLTLGCTYCGGEGSALAGDDVQRKLAEAMTCGDRERALRIGWEVNVSPNFAANEDAYARFLEIGRRRAVAAEVIAQQVRAVLGHDTSARLHQMEPPTLVVHGTLDQMLPVQNGRMIASLIPDARLEILDGVGHTFMWERPERSAELVRAHAAVHA